MQGYRQRLPFKVLFKTFPSSKKTKDYALYFPAIHHCYEGELKVSIFTEKKGEVMQNTSISQTGCDESLSHGRILRSLGTFPGQCGFFPHSVILVCHWLSSAKVDESLRRSCTQIRDLYQSTDIKYFREKSAPGPKVCVSFQLEMELQSRGSNL